MKQETKMPNGCLQRIIENQTVSIALLEDNLEISYINPACENLFQISRRMATGISLEKIIEEPCSLLERFRESLQTGHPCTEREVRLTITGRSPVTVDCTMTPLLEPNQRTSLLLEMIHRDRQLRIAREENLISQQGATHEIVRGLAHEIKNPLGGLRGAAQLLQRELPNEDLKEYTSIIIDEADRLQNLMDKMLGPSKLPVRKQTNIHEVMERVYGLVSIEVGENITIERDYDPSLPDLEADPEQLIQAILNLVRNSVQALNGEGKIVMRTRAVRQMTIGHEKYKLALVIELCDNGPGIPEEMQKKIFYPMVTGRAKGTGLGLSIAQSLVNMHHGLIECDSKPGNTVFRVILPLENENDE
jgi:two-component system nitrogen regulation sensor histidine kinase GlnL